MQKVTITAISGLIAITLASPLGAGAREDCMGVVIETPAGPETPYIDDRSGGKATFDHWSYLDSGDQAGLQTGGISRTIDLPEPRPVFPYFVDYCDRYFNRDIFLV